VHNVVCPQRRAFTRGDAISFPNINARCNGHSHPRKNDHIPQNSLLKRLVTY
jgi:hypothetical protein